VAGVTVQAITYNGTVPGPTIRVTEGDTLRVTLRNDLDQDTSIHWHGLHVPNAMDGVPGLTQPPIRPLETFTYEFTASHAGTFMYHPHVNSVAQIDSGLYGLLIIDPQTQDPTRFDRQFTMLLGAWQVSGQAPAAHGGPTAGDVDVGRVGAGMDMGYNYFSINGKAFPAVEPWTVRQGDLVRVRIANISNLAHPMHLHGQEFKVIAKDGEPLRDQWVGNTLSVGAGETYDIAILANNPGAWMFHCHELHHTENNGLEPGGLMQIIRYEGVATPAFVLPGAPSGPSEPGHGGH
jgi:FtsP/CotA-like multicopper oxidase with cupredoxin domain